MSGYFLLVAVLFLFEYILLTVIALIMSFLSVKLLNETIARPDIAKLTKNHSKKLFIYSVLSFIITFVIVVVILNISVERIVEGLENLYTYIWTLSFMPDYSDSGSVLFVFGIIAISFIFNLVFDFLLVFREIKLSRMKKFVCAIISAVMVSPYALLISFDCFFM